MPFSYEKVCGNGCKEQMVYGEVEGGMIPWQRHMLQCKECGIVKLGWKPFEETDFYKKMFKKYGRDIFKDEGVK